MSTTEIKPSANRRDGRATRAPRKATQAQQIATLTEELVRARETIRTLTDPGGDTISQVAEFVKGYRANMDAEDGYPVDYVRGYDAATTELAKAIPAQFVIEVQE